MTWRPLYLWKASGTRQDRFWAILTWQPWSDLLPRGMASHLISWSWHGTFFTCLQMMILLLPYENLSFSLGIQVSGSDSQKSSSDILGQKIENGCSNVAEKLGDCPGSQKTQLFQWFWKLLAMYFLQYKIIFILLQVSDGLKDQIVSQF